MARSSGCAPICTATSDTAEGARGTVMSAARTSLLVALGIDALGSGLLAPFELARAIAPSLVALLLTRGTVTMWVLLGALAAALALAYRASEAIVRRRDGIAGAPVEVRAGRDP